MTKKFTFDFINKKIIARILLIMLTFLIFGCTIEVSTGHSVNQEPSFPAPTVDFNVETDWSSPEEFLGPWEVSGQDFDVISFNSYTSEDKPHPHNGMVHIEKNSKQTNWGIWYIKDEDLHLEFQDQLVIIFEKPNIAEGPELYDDVINFPDGSKWIQKS